MLFPRITSITARSDDFIQSAQATSDSEALQWILQQTRSALKSLAPDLKKQYARLCTEVPALKEKLGQAMRQFTQQVDNDAIGHLTQALERHLGRPVDIFTSRLRTKIKKKVEYSFATELLTVELSLWDAARKNFGFNKGSRWLLGSGEAFHDNSRIIETGVADGAMALSSQDFVDLVRQVDLGAKFLAFFEQHFNRDIKPTLVAYQAADLKLALLEALRKNEIDLAEYNQIGATSANADIPWNAYSLSFGSELAPIDLFVCQFSDLPDTPVFSYFPGRPEGDIKRHGSIDGALESIRTSLRSAATANHLPWFLKQLSVNDQLKLQRFMNIPSVDTNQLNWLAKQLHNLLGNDSPQGARLGIELSTNADSLSTARYSHSALRFYSDALKDYQPVDEVDHATWVNGVKSVISEVIELLLTPVPGGIAGLNRLMLTTSFGTLGYQVFVGSVALSQGERSEFIQAMTDIFDLAISTSLQGVGARVSALRTRNLIKALRNPGRASNASGTSELVWPSSSTSTTIASVDSLTDTQLLKKMLSPELPALTDKQLERLLPISNIKRNALEAIWNGTQDAPWSLREAVDAQQLRSRLDALSVALEKSTSTLPVIADQVLPTLLAHMTQAKIRIYGTDRITLLSQYQPLKPGTPAAPDIVLIREGSNQYTPYFEKIQGSSQTLLAAFLREHERLDPSSSLGKRGDFAIDKDFQQRVDHLRSLLVAELIQQQPALYQTLLEDRPRADLDPRQLAYTFARTAPLSEEGQAPLGNLLQHFPDLTHTAAIQVLREYPQSTFEPTAIIPAEQFERITEIRTQSRMRQAFIALEDTAGRGLGNDAESAFAQLLTALPSWPEALGIKVLEGYQNANGINKSEKVLAHYGDESAEHFIELVRTDNTYAAYDATNDEIYRPYPGQNSLVAALLMALDDTQRDNLGYSLHDSSGLAKALVDAGSRFSQIWPVLLTYDTTYTLSSRRLAGLASKVTVSINSIDRSGVYRQDGKRYIVHAGQTYQVLKDRDASTSRRDIWRIVHPNDPVAQDESNRYVASRPGRSEPVVRDSNGQWLGIVPGGAGGMKRSEIRQEAKVLKALQDLESNNQQLLVEQNMFHRLSAVVDQRPDGPIPASIHQALTRLVTQNDTLIRLYEGELATYKKHAPLLEKNVRMRVSFFNNRARILTSLASSLYAQTTVEQVKHIDRIRDLGKYDPLNNPKYFRRLNHENITTLDFKRPYAEKAEQTINAVRQDIANIERYKDQEDAHTALAEQRSELQRYEALKPPVPYYLRLALVFYRFNLLSIEDTANPEAPFAHKPIFQDLGLQARLAIIGLKEAARVPSEHRLPVLENAQLRLEAILEQTQQQQGSLSLESDKTHLTEVLKHLQFFKDTADQQMNELFEATSEADALNRGNDDIDFDFIPAQAGSTQPKRPARKVIRVSRPQGTILVTTEVDSVSTDEVRVTQPDSGETVQTYRKQNDKWTTAAIPPPSPKDYSVVRQQASTLLQQADNVAIEANDMARRKRLPTNVYELLERNARELQQLADNLKNDSDADSQSLARQLEDKSAELLSQAKALLIRGYKDKDVLSVTRLRYLIDNNEVSVKREVSRKRTGKGAQKSFLDVYYIYDKGSDQKLWTAHFHYHKQDSDVLSFDFKSGHLKRLDQDTQGQSQQASQEQAGAKITPIWRETIDRISASELFKLAGTA